MKTKLKFICIGILIISIIGCEKEEVTGLDIEFIDDDAFIEQAYQRKKKQKRKPQSKSVAKVSAKKVYVHYMPWFFNVEEDGFWGQHWTMTNKNPDIIDENGKREIASHYYPLIGPYSSNDDDLQEYHLLLMKLCGIDGVIFDWYSSRDVHDYNDLKNSTESFIEEIEDVGLEFAIMYEDKTAQYADVFSFNNSIIDNAVLDLQYIQNTYFTSENYIKIDDSELLFLFGPNFITNPLDWENIVSRLDSTPYFMSLWAASDRLGKHAGGEFSWVDSMHMTTLSNYYEYAYQNNIQTIGGVYPGFNDFYYEGGWRPNANNDWIIDHNGVEVFDETLSLTHSSPVESIQLITWNDFGEGTMMEPTLEFGFSYLEKIQEYTGVPYTYEDLQLPYKLYLLRKKYKDDNRLQVILDMAYQAIFTLDLIYAKRLLATLERRYSV